MLNVHEKLWMKHAEQLASAIEDKRATFHAMSDDELKAQTVKLKSRYKDGESLDDLLVDAFATVRETALRVLGMEPYHVQLLGGVALHEGKIAEIRTGEGKTLIATMPSYLNALAGQGVHVVTVNDYLAERDATSMGKIHKFLGLSVGVILESSSLYQRKKAYNCDITYITNTQVGFDYLRDNLATDMNHISQRSLHYAIIDEVDSILIDEARTPLILSGNGEDVSNVYIACDKCAKSMVRGKASREFNSVEAMLGDTPEESGDFIVYEKEKNVVITADGVKKIERWFGLDNFADPKNLNIRHVMDLALRANYIMRRNKDYIQQGGEIKIVDEFTGRIMEGREYTDGLHQAIQAKEGVRIKQANAIIASTTYQHFFTKYKKVAGMTGTAVTERKEFKSIYHMDTVAIPTNEPVIRVDHEDVFFLTKQAKFAKVVEDIKQTHATGQPILVGTTSVETSERLSEMLRREGIKHQVLNAKQNKYEASIISHAGEFGSVTVATNMAGRGTDIVLDEKSREVGGLKVIGTERHEAQRIDNQLRGRSGRQGDPGESVFYISAEDHLMLYGSEKIKKVFLAGGYEEDKPITDKIVISAIRKAQDKIESNNFGKRKDVYEYDRVNDRQRELIYASRRKLIKGEDTSIEMQECLKRSVKEIVDLFAPKRKIDTKKIAKAFVSLTGITVEESDLKNLNRKSIYNILLDKIMHQYNNGYEKQQISLRESKERKCILTAIDVAWMEQIKALEFLKQDIFYTGYAQQDPRAVYAIEAFSLYNEMKANIYRSAVYFYFSEERRAAELRNNIREENVS